MIQKVDISLWLDRLQWLSYRLDHYARQQGLVRTAIAWIAQHNRLMNIQRVISETQIVIAHIQQWHRMPESVKRSIAHFEEVLFTELASVDADMHKSVQLAEQLNRTTTSGSDHSAE